MSSRGHGPPAYGGRSAQAPGMMRHGSYPVGHSIEPRHPVRADSKLIARSADVERLAADNQRLAATDMALRQELVTTQQEIQKLQAHIGSIKTETNIELRILLDKIAKAEVQLIAGEKVKKDLQMAHLEARSLVATRQELLSQLDQTTQEYEKVRADVDKLPGMHGERDGLRKEHQKLRVAFEHEKGLNMEKVAQMEVMEKDLVRMAREVEKLRAEVVNAEKRAKAPVPAPAPNVYGTYMNPPPPRVHVSGGGYIDAYGKAHHFPEGVNLYGGGHAAPVGGNPQWGGQPGIPYGGGYPGPAPPGGGNPQWSGPPYDSSYSRS